MNKTLITIAALFAAASTFAQGTLLFNTKSGTAVNAQVTYAGPPVINANGDFLGQLYWSNVGANTWSPVGANPLSFIASGAGQGYIIGGSQSIPGKGGGDKVDLQFRGWAGATIAGGSASWPGPATGGTGPGYASTALNNFGLGGDVAGQPPVPAPLLNGLQGFQIPTVPEPSFAALGLLGAGLLLIRRKK